MVETGQVNGIILSPPLPKTANPTLEESNHDFLHLNCGTIDWIGFRRINSTYDFTQVS